MASQRASSKQRLHLIAARIIFDHFISDRNYEPEHAINPEVSSTGNVANASLNVSKQLSVCHSCVEVKQNEEQIASLILENEKLKSQLESFDRNGLTPNKNNSTNVLSSPQTSPNIDCARPVDLETLFRATPRKNEIDSSSLSRAPVIVRVRAGSLLRYRYPSWARD